MIGGSHSCVLSWVGQSRSLLSVSISVVILLSCRSSSVCELVVLRGECKKVNKDRSQKQGIPGARTRAEAARQVFS